MRRPIASKSERSGTGVDMANLSKAVCHGESDKCRFGNPPQESNFQRLGISRFAGSHPRCKVRHKTEKVKRWLARHKRFKLHADIQFVAQSRRAALRRDQAPTH